MQRLSILVVTGLAVAGFAFVSYEGLSVRLTQLESAPRTDPNEVSALRDTIANDEKRIADAIVELDRLRGTPARTRELDARLDALAKQLHEASCTLRAQDEKLATWPEWNELEKEVGRHAMDERMQALRAGVDDRLERVGALAKDALGVAQGARSEVQRVEQDLTRDTDRMWRDFVGPTVQLMGDETVGSGVLLPSEPVGDTGGWRTYLITAWHVVRDIQNGSENAGMPVSVTIYAPDKSITPETAKLLEHDAGFDVALLVLETTRKVDCGAKLAPRSRLESVRIFDPVYAVGCPLGNDPIPTYGEVADTHHTVDGQHYWMISAPTYIGNSGGGIFDARTHELLGIFSKIYTHGSIRPTVVPHMGLATSMLVVYDWLDKVGYASIEPAGNAPKAQTASANR